MKYIIVKRPLSFMKGDVEQIVAKCFTDPEAILRALSECVEGGE